MDPGNNLRRVREARMLSKAELARRAGISPLTIDRIEKGMPCRIATRRKILLALGLKLSQWRRVFKENCSAYDFKMSRGCLGRGRVKF
jgi:transcriptional regulator with XRE-family HTH domain